MCGIVAAIAQRDVRAILLEGLKRLEYRGYDSAGLVLAQPQTAPCLIRCVGKVNNLIEACQSKQLHGHQGLAHTRWATHGKPSVENAHPHLADNKLALVHNGIIENHLQLKKNLVEKNHEFLSQTDSEALLHLVAHNYHRENDLLSSVQRAVKEVVGAFGAVFMHADEPDVLIAARCGSPLVIGCGFGENFVASDQHALLPVTDKFIILEEGDIAKITQNEVTIFDAQGERVYRAIHVLKTTQESSEKGAYRHYMLKEIYEQPAAVTRVLEGRITQTGVQDDLFGQGSSAVLKKAEHVQIVACGTSYYSGLLAKYWLEDWLNMPCSVDIASEFRYRNPAVPKNSLFLTISQSGETADTLATLNLPQIQKFLSTLTLCNVPHSSLVRDSDYALLLRAGTEIGVASTKAFTTQMAALLLFVLALGQAQEKLSEAKRTSIVTQLRCLPAYLDAVLQKAPDIQTMASAFVEQQHCLFLGRGCHYPIAMEGALKLKELSYIHAEAYAGGELKHGPLALVDADLPVIVLAPDDALLEKLKSNIAEVKTRGGLLYVFAQEGVGFRSEANTHVITLPNVETMMTPIVYTLPLQLFAYYVALIKGTDVDQPRNLAKSVTVE